MSARVERLIVGLGNPGSDFIGTRHNAGFEIVERLARRHGIELARGPLRARCGTGPIAGRRCALLLPETMMNASGDAVVAALDAFPDVSLPSGLLVAYDDLDLPVGRIRLRPSGGAGGQRGLAHIIEAIGSQDFARLRFGIGRPAQGVAVRDHVLGRPSGEEAVRVSGRLEVAAEAIESMLADGIERAMDRYNQSDAAGPAPSGAAGLPVGSSRGPVSSKSPGPRWRSWLARLRGKQLG